MNFRPPPAFAFRLLLLALAAYPAVPQQQSPAPVNAPRHFEVASIRPSKPGAVVQDARVSFQSSRFEALNVTLNNILQTVFGYSSSVQGGPKWAETDRYDIVAKAAGEVAPRERMQMVMALLEDRFKLAIHHATKEASGLSLVAGKRPPNLDPAPDGEATDIHRDERRQMIFRAVTMNGFALYLHQIWRVPVEDHTGMEGKFDFALDLDRAATEIATQPPAPPSSFGDILRTAVEQYGFRLEPRKATVEVTMIDHVERPSEN